MTFTTNLSLKKPEYSDAADIVAENDNMDILDAALARMDADKADNTITASGSIAVSDWTGSGPYTVTLTPTPQERTNCTVSVDFSGLTNDQAEEIMGCGICEQSHTDTTITLRAIGDKPTCAVPVTYTYFD